MFLAKPKARKEVGLILDSGGFRGFAHIGAPKTVSYFSELNSKFRSGT